MGQAADHCDVFMASPENLLSEMVPLLVRLRTYFEACRGTGATMEARARQQLDGFRKGIPYAPEQASGDADHVVLAPYTRALLAAVCDLLNPVWVRDTAINATGRLSGNDRPLSYAESDDNSVRDGAVCGVSYSIAP